MENFIKLTRSSEKRFKLGYFKEAIDTINSKLVPIKNRYGFFLKTISWIGLIFLILFSLLLIANSVFLDWDLLI